MNPSCGKGSMLTSSRKSSEVVLDQFPAGLRVLVVDDDPTCLKIVEKMLRTCHYEVTTCNRAESALASLQANRNGFDIVISDVHMPDMDGFKLLELIGLEMDLPVIMMSADDGKQVVMKGVTHGACDYLIKPIRIEELKNIWQHVVRKRKNEWKELEQSVSIEDGGDKMQKQSEDVDYSSSANEVGNWKSSKRRKDDEDELEDKDDTSTLKKPRVVWSVELHQQFVAAVNQLGIDKAVPKKILELMNVPGLTRENVASHLQKYRLYLRRLSGVPQHQGGINASFIGTQDATFSPISSLTGLDLRALAVAGQLPEQSLSTLHAASFARPSPKSGQPVPMVDQRNIFSFNNSKFKTGEGQLRQPNLGNSNQMNLLHGIPTTMEPKQLAELHQSFENMSNMQASVCQSNSLLMHRGSTRFPPNMGQPLVSNGLPGGLVLRNISAENGRGLGGYASPVSQTTSSAALTFPMNHGPELPGSNSFPTLGSPPGIPSLTQKGPSKEDIPVNSDAKGSSAGGIIPGYYLLNDLQQLQSNDWEVRNVGLAFNSPQNTSSLTGNLENPASSLFVQQGISSGSMRNSSSGGGSKVSYLVEGTHHQNLSSIVNSSVRIKSESVADTGCQNILYTQHFGQEDLMSVLLKQVSTFMTLKFFTNWCHLLLLLLLFEGA
ncbi:hypothetical protein SAY86_012788 [Trapa natans]|uniref:Two-component response regulator n=1 Tax=Trapa natans TaxID=22666 RepID=A0AAN7R7J8_TRANT|nr:hypothetical protein SAY86_012788 [Trapa natans]